MAALDCVSILINFTNSESPLDEPIARWILVKLNYFRFEKHLNTNFKT